MYWAKLSAAMVTKTYESQTGSNINWQAHTITNNTNSRVTMLVNIKYVIQACYLLSSQNHNKIGPTMFTQYKNIASGLGTVLQIQKVTVQSPALGMVTARTAFPRRQKAAERRNTGEFLQENAKTVSNAISQKTDGVHYYRVCLLCFFKSHAMYTGLASNSCSSCLSQDHRHMLSHLAQKAFS